MNKRQILAVFTGLLSLTIGVLAVKLVWFSSGDTPPAPPPPQVNNLAGNGHRLSGPYSHKNLTVYLVHGEDQLSGKTPLTLAEAMDRKLVIVHETSDVNELQIENVSASDEVYVQAGDIVKGGKQDRVLAVDLIVPARSGRMPLDAFCVEQGRWTMRRSESSEQFNSANETVVSKDLKMAAKHSKSQGEVWSGVEQSQRKLSAATNADVASNASRSSLPLALENSNVRADSGAYIDELKGVVDGKTDVIGFVFAINGEINSADTYGSAALFLKLWPRLLKASSIEAVAESSNEEDPKTVVIEEVNSFLTDAESGSVTDNRTVTKRITITTRETKRSIFLETLDRGTMLHRNYIMK